MMAIFHLAGTTLDATFIRGRMDDAVKTRIAELLR